jgi:RNA polymerase sigma-70 factor, ECF subfamily
MQTVLTHWQSPWQPLNAGFGFDSSVAEPARAESTVKSLRSRIDAFLRALEKRAFKMAMMSLKNPDDALDAVQDAMTQFVKSYSEKPEADWPRLFYTVLDSKVVDALRRRSTRARWISWWPRQSDSDSLDGDLLDVSDEAALDPSELVDAQTAGAAIERALSLLPQRQRQAFLLRIWEGFDVAQTASIMQCSEGSVKTHLSRAMSALRLRLEDFDGH